MPATPAADHDQRLKVLLKEFFEQFFRCFFPVWAERFDFSDLTWNLDEAQRQRLQALLTTEQYQEVRPLMMTTYERGVIEGQRRMVLAQLETRFGPLAPTVKQRVEELSSEQLQQLSLDLVKGRSLQEMHLED